MAVNIQRKGDSGVAQVLGDRLDRITDPDGVCCVCVAEVMEAGFRNSDLCNDFLQVLQDCIVDQVPAGFIDEDQVVFVLPRIPGSQFVFRLLLLNFLQNLHHIRRRLDGASLVVLWRDELIGAGAASLPDLLQLALDRDRSVDEVHTVPAQAEDFSLPHAGEYIHKEQVAERIVFDLSQEIREEGAGDRPDIFLLDPG